ncbi:hypothetical protein [Pedobacter frigoris]|uniref:hypothetical protein n=1 Tax=Pedobacter frigoris TaxID=2571272 RepID=UPI0029301A6B|nr:hypothetical protein [Pedobacter frigoris]
MVIAKHYISSEYLLFSIGRGENDKLFYNNLSKFEQELEYLTGRSATMGLEELLLDIAKNEGKSEGLEIGEHNKAIEIARELKIEGLAIEFIAKTTKLSVEEVKEL